MGRNKKTAASTRILTLMALVRQRQQMFVIMCKLMCLLQVLNLQCGLVLWIDGENLLGKVLCTRDVLVEVRAEHQVVEAVLQHGVLALATVCLVHQFLIQSLAVLLLHLQQTYTLYRVLLS